jgi:hypothetical protein
MLLQKPELCERGYCIRSYRVMRRTTEVPGPSRSESRSGNLYIKRTGPSLTPRPQDSPREHNSTSFRIAYRVV